MSDTPSDPNEPSQHFHERCLEIVTRWEQDRMPYDRAVEALDWLIREATSQNLLADVGRVEQARGYIEHYRGNLNASIHHYERARALYERAGNFKRAALCDMNMGETYRYKGDFARARVLSERAYLTFKAMGDHENAAFALGNKGQLLLSKGHLDKAYVDLIGSYEIASQLPAETPGRSALLCEIHHALTLLYIQRGDYGAAWEQARQSYGVAEEFPNPVERGFAYLAIAEIQSVFLLQEGNADESISGAYFEAACDSFRQIDAEGEVARTLFAHALSLMRYGRRQIAARKLQQAMIQFTRLGMQDDAARAAEAQLELL